MPPLKIRSLLNAVISYEKLFLQVQVEVKYKL